MGGATVKVKVRGADQLTRLARELEKQAAGKLRRKLLTGIKRATAGLPEKARQGALDELPKHGGLAELIATEAVIRSRTNLGKNVGVNIIATDPHKINRMDKGQLRHPLFGNRSHWYDQAVRPGWFSRPMRAAAPAVREAIVAVVDEVAAEIERST